MFGALKRGFRNTASLIHVLVRNVVGVLQPKRILAASRGFLAAARLSCYTSSVNWFEEGVDNGNSRFKTENSLRQPKKPFF